MNSRSFAPTSGQPRLLDQVRERARHLHYSLRTEKAYVYWVRWFVRWSGMRHPRDMGEPQVKAFLTMLATQRKVSSSTHNQALSALLFLYREVLDSQLPWMADVQRPALVRRIPPVLTRDEVKALLDSLTGDVRLIAQLLYGTGMRLMEAIGLRIKDVDFDRTVIVVRQAKGNKDRVVMLPAALAQSLRTQVSLARRWWEIDCASGAGGVEVPHALEAKYPKVGHTWGWFWVFPSPRPRSTSASRHTRCATASPPTCCNPARTSAPCRNFSAIAT